MNRLYALALLFALPACDNTGTDAADYTPLLATLTDGVAVPEVASFTATADALSPTLVTLAARPNAANLTAAQTAWRAARAAWRKLDAVNFGPVADDGIASRIDVSPADDAGLDAIVNGTDVINDAYVAALGGKQKGFLGLEHLIFSASGPDAALASLTGAGGGRRLALAVAISDEITSSAHQLKDGWTTFATEVKTAGHGSTRYTIQQQALTLYVGGAITTLENLVGTRLAVPLGRKNDGIPNGSLDPTTASDSAVADMNAMLAGIDAMWATPGYTDYVKDSNIHAEAASEQAACDKAVAKIPGPFATSVMSQTATVQDAYNQCKVWKNLWYTDLAHAIGASQPVLVNDGD